MGCFQINWTNCLRDYWIRRPTDAAACQLLFLFLGGNNDAARCDKRGLRWGQHSQIVILLMDIVSGSLRFDSALKPSIISTVRCIRNAQIVDAFVRSVVDSVILVKMQFMKKG